MNRIEFIQYIDKLIKAEILLGSAKNENVLAGLRNIKSDFNYIASKTKDIDVVEILKKLYRERKENAELYKDSNRLDLWLQENTEKTILDHFIPEEPSVDEVKEFLSSLTDIPKTKASFKKYQEKCLEKFGQKIDSQIILDFISEK